MRASCADYVADRARARGRRQFLEGLLRWIGGDDAFLEVADRVRAAVERLPEGDAGSWVCPSECVAVRLLRHELRLELSSPPRVAGECHARRAVELESERLGHADGQAEALALIRGSVVRAGVGE